MGQRSWAVRWFHCLLLLLSLLLLLPTLRHTHARTHTHTHTHTCAHTHAHVLAHLCSRFSPCACLPLVEYTFASQTQQLRGVVFNAPPTVDLVNLNHAIVGTDVTIAMQQRDLQETQTLVCRVTLASLQCTEPNQLHTRSSTATSDAVAVTGFSSVVAVAYTSVSVWLRHEGKASGRRGEKRAAGRAE